VSGKKLKLAEVENLLVTLEDFCALEPEGPIGERMQWYAATFMGQLNDILEGTYR
jgi:hypothetical protein